MSAPPPRRQLIGSGSPFEPLIGFSRAVRVGDRVLVAGTAPTWPDGHVDPDAEAQAGRCLEIDPGGPGRSRRERRGRRPYAELSRGCGRLAGRGPGAWPCLRRRTAGVHDGRRGGAARRALEGGDRGRGRHRLWRGRRSSRSTRSVTRMKRRIVDLDRPGRFAAIRTTTASEEGFLLLAGRGSRSRGGVAGARAAGPARAAPARHHR